MEVSGKLDASAAWAPGKNPGTQWTGGWVGPEAGLEVLKKRKISSLLKTNKTIKLKMGHPNIL